MHQRRPPDVDVAPAATTAALDPSWLPPPELAPAAEPSPDLELPAADPTALLPWLDDDAGRMHADTGPEIPRGVKYDPKWMALAHGNIKESTGPQSVRLPDEVVRDLAESSARTARDGNEHGGNIVRTRGGDYNVRHGGEGTPDSFFSDDDDIGFGETHVGGTHSHPGAPDAFSEHDIANMADSTRNLSIMQNSAGEQRMLVRTKEFQAIVDKVEAQPDHSQLMEDRNAFRREMMDTYNAAYAEVYKGDRQDLANHAAATEAPTRATAAKYHLLYYSGKAGKLTRAGAAPKRKP